MDQNWNFRGHRIERASGFASARALHSMDREETPMTRALGRELPETLAVNVRTRRESLNMTREELAKAAGITASGLQRIEKATRWIGPVTIEKLAKALGVKAWSLFLPVERD